MVAVTDKPHHEEVSNLLRGYNDGSGQRRGGIISADRPKERKGLFAMLLSAVVATATDVPQSVHQCLLTISFDLAIRGQQVRRPRRRPRRHPRPRPRPPCRPRPRPRPARPRPRPRPRPLIQSPHVTLPKVLTDELALEIPVLGKPRRHYYLWFCGRVYERDERAKEKWAAEHLDGRPHDRVSRDRHSAFKRLLQVHPRDPKSTSQPGCFV